MGHLVRECLENVHNVVDESQLCFGFWLKASSVGYGRDRAGQTGRTGTPLHLTRKRVLLVLIATLTLPELIIAEPETVAGEQSCFIKDPGKMVAVTGPTVDEGVVSFVFRSSLEESGGFCSVMTMVGSGGGNVVFKGSLDLSGDLSVVH
ncbi:hypothetical protein ACOSP7_020938 [Xanthoceras sorbifolium]